jgi:AAA15 family ATPase/GTPase
MLLNFRFKNFRSFYDEQELSMIATSITEHNHYLMEQDDYHVLPSAIIYGANASGKSNVIKALMLLKEIVLSGSIEKNNSLMLDVLELLPFIHDKKMHDEPVLLSIECKIDGYVYLYELKIQVSIESNKDKCRRCIAGEKLSVNDVLLFERNKKAVTLHTDDKALEIFKCFDCEDIYETKKILTNSINKNLDELKLFLSIGFKNFVCSKCADLIINWFAKNLKLYENYEAMDYYSFDSFETDEEDLLLSTSFWNIYFKNAEIGPQEIFIKKENEINDLVSVYKVDGLKNELVMSSWIMESDGTLNMHKLSDVVLYILLTGSVLVMDELGNSLHPDLISSIIRAFNDLDINKRGAQLIMTSHNPALLSAFRRDQIYFTEKNEAFKSTLYSLYDFKEDRDRVRKDAALMKNYINGNYGAVPNSDFAGSIKKFINEFEEFIENNNE